MASPITVPGFVDQLVRLYHASRAQQAVNNRMIPNEYALSNRGVYPGAAYDLAKGGVNLGNVMHDNPAALNALVAILKSGGGWMRA